MNHDQIAVYLNEHLEFFNDYPELLQKIHSIEIQDLPIKPLKSLSVAGRIIERANADKEHLKSQLEWLVEVARKNEKIHQHLSEIERMILSSTHFPQMIRELCGEIVRRFEVKHVRLFLVDGEDHFIEKKMQDRFTDDLGGLLTYSDQDTLDTWFEGDIEPVLIAETRGQSRGFANEGDSVQSEALIPITIRKRVAGALALGSLDSGHFHEGLRTEYLERLADKLALAIDNILLLDLVKRSTVLDEETGFYNGTYLHPIFLRECDRAQRHGKSLSCIKMRIDYFEDLIDTYGRETFDKILGSAGQILRANCRAGEILIRNEVDQFIILLPEVDRDMVKKIAHRMDQSVHENGFGLPSDSPMKVSVTIESATFPDALITTAEQLLEAVGMKSRAEEALPQSRTIAS